MVADDLTASALAEELARLRRDFLLRLPTELAALQALAASLSGDESDRSKLNDLLFRLHTLAGVPSVFEVASLSARARILEHRVQDWLDNESLDKVDSQARKTLAKEVADLGSIQDMRIVTAGGNRYDQ